jgi:hypothetical protein
MDMAPTKSLTIFSEGRKCGTGCGRALRGGKELENTPPLLTGVVQVTSSANTVLSQSLSTNVLKQYTA